MVSGWLPGTVCVGQILILHFRVPFTEFGSCPRCPYDWYNKSTNHRSAYVHTHTRGMTDVYADLSTGPRTVLETTHCKRRHENNYLNIHNIFGNSVCIEEGRFVGVCCTHSHYEHWKSRIRDVSRRKACAILDWKEMGLCCPFSSVDATQLRADATRASQIGTPLALRYVSCCSQIQCRS